jgi:hypothetical protein
MQATSTPKEGKHAAMDEQSVRTTVEAHAQAVVDPIDLEHVERDFIDDLRPQIPAIAGLLPLPVSSAQVDSLHFEDDHAIAHITYTGDSGSMTIRTLWEDRGAGQAQIVEGAPAPTER